MFNLKERLKEKDNVHLLLSIGLLLAIILLIGIFLNSLPRDMGILAVILFIFIKIALVIMFIIGIILEIKYALKVRKTKNISFLKSNKTLHFWFMIALIHFLLINTNNIWQIGSNILGLNEVPPITVSTPLDERNIYLANGNKELPKEVPYSYKYGLEEKHINLNDKYTFKIKDIDENKSIYYATLKNCFFTYDKTTNQIDVDEKYIDWGVEGYLIDEKYFIEDRGMSFAVYDIDERKTTYKSNEQFGWGLRGIDKNKKLFYIIEETGIRNIGWKNFYLFELKDNGDLIQKDCIAFFSSKIDVSHAIDHIPAVYDSEKNLLYIPSINYSLRDKKIEYKTRVDLNFWKKMNKLFSTTPHLTSSTFEAGAFYP